MKKLISIIISVLSIAFFVPFSASAAGGFSVSTSSITLHPGESTSFSVTASNAAGRINISSSNPGVASVNTGAIFLDLDSGSVVVTAGSLGSATISVVASSNFATYDEENLGGQSRTITANVVELPQPAPTPDPAPTPTPAPVSNNIQSSTPQNQPSSSDDTETEEPNKSSNTNVTIEIDGYEVTKEDGFYKAIIPHDISKISIKITPEDEKTIVEGGGEIDLKVGENAIEIKATAEDGTVKVYNLEITREDSCQKCPENTECPPQSPIFLIISIVEGIAILLTAVFFIIKKIKKDSEKDNKISGTPYSIL